MTSSSKMQVHLFSFQDVFSVRSCNLKSSGARPPVDLSKPADRLVLQTDGRRAGSSCRLRSPKPSSSWCTFTSSNLWGLGSWRTAKPSTSRESSSSTTLAWWRSRSTCATRWVLSLVGGGCWHAFPASLGSLFTRAVCLSVRLVPAVLRNTLVHWPFSNVGGQTSSAGVFVVALRDLNITSLLSRPTSDQCTAFPVHQVSYFLFFFYLVRYCRVTWVYYSSKTRMGTR